MLALDCKQSRIVVQVLNNVQQNNKAYGHDICRHSPCHCQFQHNEPFAEHYSQHAVMLRVCGDVGVAHNTCVTIGLRHFFLCICRTWYNKHTKLIFNIYGNPSRQCHSRQQACHAASSTRFCPLHTNVPRLGSEHLCSSKGQSTHKSQAIFHSATLGW